MENHSFKIGQMFKDEHGETLTIVAIEEDDLDGYGTVYVTSSLEDQSIYTKIKNTDSVHINTIPFFLETFLEKLTHVQNN